MLAEVALWVNDPWMTWLVIPAVGVKVTPTNSDIEASWTWTNSEEASPDPRKALKASSEP